jgi:sterol desaturase/sphingolipid hydroxylase (fatty acid hydroxylase superfamily)
LLSWNDAFRGSVTQVPAVVISLFVCAGAFLALAIAVKGLKRAIADGKAAAEQTRINAILSAVDQALTLMAAGAGMAVRHWGLQLDEPGLWAAIGPVPTALATVFLGDFLGYWRHRVQHTSLLWPAHAIHHSDTNLTWFTLERMHPIDRAGSMVDTLILAGLGFPPWALGVNVAVRHYYGYFIHTDAPWTFGKLGWVLNSPAMHRWHHARDIEGSGSNFATVFSVFDRLFGTYYQPGPCDQPLGVREDMGRGVIGQYLYPFRVWLKLERPAALSGREAQPAN